ncbi:MAG: hypothetical protein KC502_22465 [Myxococcales bacterium]|nr:hypothetical protein [Myxococcales bacterium]
MNPLLLSTGRIVALCLAMAWAGCGEIQLVTLSAATDDAGSGATGDSAGDGSTATDDGFTDGQDGGEQPPIPHVSISIGPKSLCGIVGDKVLSGAGDMKQPKVVSDAAKLGFQPSAIFCPTAKLLVVSGSTASGEARVATIDFAGPPTIAKAGQGSLIAIAGRGMGDIIAVGWRAADGQVLSHSAVPTKNPLKWAPIPELGGTVGLRAVSVRGDGHRVAVGAAGIIVQSAGPKGWTGAKVVGAAGSLNGVWSSPTGPFHAVGVGGTLLIRKGIDWHSSPRNTSADITWRAISGYNDGVAVAVADEDAAVWTGNKWLPIALDDTVPRPMRAVGCTMDLSKRTVHLVDGHLLRRCYLSLEKSPKLFCGKPGPKP